MVTRNWSYADFLRNILQGRWHSKLNTCQTPYIGAYTIRSRPIQRIVFTKENRTLSSFETDSSTGL